MAKIKRTEASAIAAGMETVKEPLTAYSIRMYKSWLDELHAIAAQVSQHKKYTVRATDLIREAVFQKWIKPTTGDKRDTVL